MDPGVEDSVNSRKEPSVDHCDTQWIPAFAGIHKGAPVMKHPRSTSWPTNPTERSTYRRDQQPEKVGACGRSTFSGYKQGPHFFKTLPVYVF